MTNQMNQMNRQQLFNLINTASFAVDDLLLFLDTHPDDVEAIKAFHHYSDIRRNALQVYSDQYGPLTIEGSIRSTRSKIPATAKLRRCTRATVCSTVSRRWIKRG